VKRTFQILWLMWVMLFLATSIIAQSASASKQPSRLTLDIRNLVTNIERLQNKKGLLEKRLNSFSPGTADYVLMEDWIRELGNSIEELKGRSGEPNEDAQLPQAAQVFDVPAFKLSRPLGATQETTDLMLAWTEDHPCPFIQCPAKTTTYTIKKFVVEISTSPRRFPNNIRFEKPVFTVEQVSDGSSAQSIKVPKETLKSGQKYYWQVFAEYQPNGSVTDLLLLADNAKDRPQTFRTETQTFLAFESRGFSLQRAVSGDDAAEGAQFGFLKTFKQKTVYSADFALIFNRNLANTQRSSAGFQASVQGNLASDESESEDALQFRAGAIIDRNLKRNTINHLYASLGAKYETDKKFKVGKLISENMITPTLPALGIGVPFGKSSDPFQFRWRPSFYFDIGHTFERGDSTEAEQTVLRLTPRLYTRLSLNFLRRRLNLNDVSIFADDYFYSLPLEKTKNRHNMFTSGFVLQVNKDFGFGLTYKSGEAAPKFKPVHTFGGVLTIRFGKEE